MDRKEWTERQVRTQNALLREQFEGEVEDDDIWNLEYLITTIGYQSHTYRLGCISSLKRAIKALRKENEEEEKKWQEENRQTHEMIKANVDKFTAAVENGFWSAGGESNG